MKQEWITGEVFEAVFPLPNEVFQLGLKAGDLLVYIYLQYQKGVRSGQCWPSYATIGKAVGMSRKTVQKHIGALVDKGLVQTEETTIRRKNGFVYNGSLLYTLKPIQQVMEEREKELLAKLKLAEAQRKWAQRYGTAMAKA
ncbi:MAG: helix-turn-helix domain-containing protein [Oscillospiraceae bacterium]|nr:helix-turn-helix domain-containing protein [Oscillospiraceae bacterium]